MTLRHAIEDQIPIRAYCYADGCGHSVDLDLPALAQKLGLDHGALHNDLVPKMSCVKCGSKRCGIRLGYSRLHKGVHKT